MGDYFDPEPAFTTGGARRAGFTRRDIDADFLDRPFHGLRSAEARVPGDDVARGEQQLSVIGRKALQFHAYMASHEFFSHTTAAVLWGISLPLLHDEAIHVSVCPPHRAPRGAGVHGHQLATRGVTITTRDEQDLRVTSAAATWALLGAVLRHPYDLVAAADSVIRVDRVPGPKGRVIAPALGTVAEMASAFLPKRRGGSLSEQP